MKDINAVRAVMDAILKDDQKRVHAIVSNMTKNAREMLSAVDCLIEIRQQSTRS